MVVSCDFLDLICGVMMQSHNKELIIVKLLSHYEDLPHHYGYDARDVLMDPHLIKHVKERVLHSHPFKAELEEVRSLNPSALILASQTPAPETDLRSIMRGSSTPIVPILQSLYAANLTCPVFHDPFWMCDIYAGCSAGTTYKAFLESQKFFYDVEDEEIKIDVFHGHQDWIEKSPRAIIDSSAITLIYASAHRAAQIHPNAQILLDFYNSNMEVLSANKSFYEKLAILLPPNVVLRLYYYNGSVFYLLAAIPGKGEEFDKNFEWSICTLALLEGIYPKKISESVDAFKEAFSNELNNSSSSSNAHTLHHIVQLFRNTILCNLQNLDNTPQFTNLAMPNLDLMPVLMKFRSLPNDLPSHLLGPDADNPGNYTITRDLYNQKICLEDYLLNENQVKELMAQENLSLNNQKKAWQIEDVIASFNASSPVEESDSLLPGSIGNHGEEQTAESLSLHSLQEEEKDITEELTYEVYGQEFVPEKLVHADWKEKEKGGEKERIVPPPRPSKPKTLSLPRSSSGMFYSDLGMDDDEDDLDLQKALAESLKLT